MPSLFAALSLGFFVLVSELSAAPSAAPAPEDDNPYSVEMPAKTDTTKQTSSKVTPPVAKVVDTSKSVPKSDTAVVLTKATKAKAAKDSAAAVKRKAAAVKDSLKAAKLLAKKDSTAKALAIKDSIALQKKDSTKALSKRDTATSQKKDSVLAKNGVKDTLLNSKKDSVTTPVTTAKPSDTTAKTSDSTRAARKPKPRLVRETTINTINQMKGNYRSPKRALFMSLVVPGLGQAYVGQSAFNYSRAALYLGTDVLMGFLWYQYVVVKHDRTVAKYHHLADTGWSQSQYEDAIANFKGTGFELRNPTRALENGYCDAVLPAGDTANLAGCKDPVTNPNYSTFNSLVHDNETPFDSIGSRRSRFTDAYQLYEMIGQEQEFVTGWRDAVMGPLNDSLVIGTSASRSRYIEMRAQANRYSRMQAWFAGGIVLNHIVSALDAALTARYNNKRLYESEAMWFDRLRLNGGLVFDQGWPKTNVIASVSF